MLCPRIENDHGNEKYTFLNSQIFFASSIKLLSCCCWANVVSFEHGWSYRKNSNAGKFVFSYRFIHKNFRLVRGPVFCPVSGFCTSDGHIEKKIMQENFFCHTGSFTRIIFPVVRGPVFCPVSGFCTSDGCIKISLYRKISVVLQIVFSEFIVLKRIFRLVFFEFMKIKNYECCP